jgi:hypothetical protein
MIAQELRREMRPKITAGRPCGKSWTAPNKSWMM